MAVGIEVKLTQQEIRIGIRKHEWYREMGLRKKKCKNITKTIKIIVTITNRSTKYYNKIKTALVFSWIRITTNSC